MPSKNFNFTYSLRGVIALFMLAPLPIIAMACEQDLPASNAYFGDWGRVSYIEEIRQPLPPSIQQTCRPDQYNGRPPVANKKKGADPAPPQPVVCLVVEDVQDARTEYMTRYRVHFTYKQAEYVQMLAYKPDKWVYVVVGQGQVIAPIDGYSQ